MLSKYAEQLTTAKRNFILGLVTDIEERNEYNSYDTFPFGEKGKRNTLDNQRRFNINLREPTRGDVSLQPHFLRDQLENRFAADREAWLSVPELQQQQQYQNPKHPNSVNISSSADEVAAGSANTTAITAGGPSNVSSIEHHHSVTFASGHVAAPYPNIMSDSQQREEHGGYGNNINNNVFLHPCSTPTGGAADGEVVCLPLPSYASKLGGQVSTLRKEVKHLTEMLIEGYGADFFAELLIGTEYHPSNRGRVSLLKGQGEAVGVTSSAQAELVRGGLGTHGNEAPANAHFLLTQYRNFMAARDEEERIIEKEIRADMTIKRLSSLSGIHLRACERAKEMMANGGIAAFQRQQRINTPSEDTSDNDNSMETTASYGKQKIKESSEERKLGREAPTYYGTNKTPRATFVSDDKGTMLIEGVKSAADSMVPAVDIIRAQILLSHILQAAEKHDEDAHAAVEAAKRSDVLVTEVPAVVIDEKRGDSDEERYRKGVDQYRSKVQSKKRKGEGRSGEGQELDGDTYNDEEEDDDDDDDDIVPKAARAPRYRNTKNVDSSYRAVDQWRRGNKNPSRKSCRINDDDEQDSDSESDSSDDIHVKREKWQSTKQREKGKKKDSKKVPTLLTSLQKDSSSTTISSILKGARAVRNSNTVTSNDSSGVIALDNRNRTSPTGESSLSPDGRQTASSFSRTDSEKTKMNSKSNNRDALNKLNNSNNYNNNSQFLEQGNDSIFAGNQSGTLLRGDRSKGPRSNQDNTTTTSSSVVGFVDDIDIERQKGDKRNSSYRSHDGSNINANRISNSSSSTPGSNAKKSDSSRNINSSDTLSCGPPVVRSGWSNSCGNMLTKEDNQGAKEKKNRDNNNTYGKKNSAKSTSFERRCSTESSSSDSDIDPTAASRRMAETGVLESVQEITAGSSSDDSETSGGRERERETTSRKSWNQSNNQGSRRSSVRTKSEDGEEKKSKRKFPKIKIPKFKLPEYKLPKLKLPKKLPFKIPSWPKSFCTGRKDGVVER